MRTVKILGKNYDVKVEYKSIKTPELNLQENSEIKITLPYKYKKMGNEQILKMSIEKSELIKKLLIIVSFEKRMFNPVLFVCNDGVNIDIFNAFENIAFHLWVNFFHLTNHIFDFLTLGSIIRVAGSASIRKLAGTLDKVQIVIITPALNFILTDKIHRAN